MIPGAGGRRQAAPQKSNFRLICKRAAAAAARSGGHRLTKPSQTINTQLAILTQVTSHRAGGGRAGHADGLGGRGRVQANWPGGLRRRRHHPYTCRRSFLPCHWPNRATALSGGQRLTKPLQTINSQLCVLPQITSQRAAGERTGLADGPGRRGKVLVKGSGGLCRRTQHPQLALAWQRG